MTGWTGWSVGVSGRESNHAQGGYLCQQTIASRTKQAESLRSGVGWQQLRGREVRGIPKRLTGLVAVAGTGTLHGHDGQLSGGSRADLKGDRKPGWAIHVQGLSRFPLPVPLEAKIS